MTLTVGLDLSSEPVRATGVGRYGLALCRELGALAPPDVRFVAFAPRALGVQGMPVVATPGATAAARRAFQQAGVPVRALAAGVQVLHSVNNLGPVLWPRAGVLTFHDAKLYRAAAGGALPARLYRRGLHRLSARRADLVLVPSRWSKEEAVLALGVDPDRVRVVPEGVDAAPFDPAGADAAADRRVLSRYGLERGGYVLAVGTREPAKNLPRALQAFAQAAPPPLLLALAGGAGWGGEDLQAQARALGVAARVRLLGYVPHLDLPALYRGCRAFLFPSLVEGFGLPILEAFAAGAPVVTSTATACPETAGGAAVLVDPLDPAAIAGGLRRALEDEALRADLVRRGLARARAATWTDTARGTLEVYREAWARRL